MNPVKKRSRPRYGDGHATQSKVNYTSETDIYSCVDLAEAALYYALDGYKVLPLEPRGKRPLFRLANGVKHATTDPETVAEWWRLEPEANIGLVVPDGHAVIDVDTRNTTGTPAQLYRKLRQRLGTLPATMTALTGSGNSAAHLWFRLPVEAEDTVGAIDRAIEVKHAGQYLVAPPSIHRSGNRYQWTAYQVPALLPQQALAEITRRYPEAAPIPRPRPRRYPAGLITWAAEAAVGERDQRLFNVACRLLEDGHPAAVIADLAEAVSKRNRGSIGLPDRQINSTINSAYKRIQKRGRAVA